MKPASAIIQQLIDELSADELADAAEQLLAASIEADNQVDEDLLAAAEAVLAWLDKSAAWHTVDQLERLRDAIAAVKGEGVTR